MKLCFAVGWQTPQPFLRRMWPLVSVSSVERNFPSNIRIYFQPYAADQKPNLYWIRSNITTLKTASNTAQISSMGRIHIPLVSIDVLCLMLISTRIYDANHHPYIAKGAGMRTLNGYYQIGTIIADYDRSASRVPALLELRNRLRTLLFFAAFDAAESRRNDNNRAVGNATSFHTFLFITTPLWSSSRVAPGNISRTGGSGPMWIRLSLL